MSGATEQFLARLRALDIRLRVEAGRLRVNAPADSLTAELEAELRASKDALIALLTGEPDVRREPPTAIASIPRATPPFPLSFVQQSIWILSQLEPENTSYNLAMLSPERTGVPDPEMLVAAIRDVVTAHDILRSRVVLVNGVPVMEVDAAEATPISIVDLRHASRDQQRQALDDAAEAAANAVIDLATDGTARFTVFRTAGDACVLLTVVHHIAADAWSLSSLETEIDRALLARAAGERLPRARVQYADYAQWERALNTGAEASASRRYWQQRLQGVPPTSTFLPDRARTHASAGDGGTFDFELPAALCERLHQQVRAMNGTVYMALVAAMAAVLSRYTRQTDLALGSPFGARETPELEAMLGPVLNPLVLRLDLSDDPSFTVLFSRARDAVLDAHEHRRTPFEELVQAMHPDRAAGQSPVFQVAVILHNAPADHDVQIVSGGAVYDVTWYAHEDGAVLHCGIEYRTDLFDAATIRRLARHLEQFLASALRDPNLPVSVLEMLSPADVAEVLAFNPPQVALDERTVIEQFDAMAMAHPDRIAITAEGESLTYAELARQSARIASALAHAGTTPGCPAALASDRASSMVVALLGILRGGGVYVPVDPEYPAGRFASILRDAGCQHLLATRQASGMLAPGAAPEHQLIVDDILEAAEPHAVVGAGHLPSPSDVAYVMYTSGATGVPLGVEVAHTSLSNLLGAMRGIVRVDRDTAMIAAAPLTSDMSIVEMLLPLTAGGRVVIASRDDVASGQRMGELLRKTSPTVVQLTPSGWQALLASGWEGNGSIVAIASGERLSGELAARIHERVGVLLNGWGDIETTIYSSMSAYVPDAPVPNGGAIANSTLYVLDAHSRPTPIGGVGELHVGGAGVALRYRQRDELTAAHFMTDPFVVGQDARMYRTGDLGRWRNDGSIERFGRTDDRINLRGYRIEPGDVERAIMSHRGVKTAAVAVRALPGGDPRLMAWVVLHPSIGCTATELRRHLRTQLPEFMVPSMVSFLEALPLTVRGTVDHTALPDPFAAGRSSVTVDPPRTTTERLIAEVWTSLIGVAPTSRADLFFELGGYSLLAMRAAREISDRTGTTVDPRTLFFRSLGDIAAACDEQRAALVALAP